MGAGMQPNEQAWMKRCGHRPAEGQVVAVHRESIQMRCATGQKRQLTDSAKLGLLTGFSFHHSTAKSVHMSIEIKIRKNEPIDRALRRMKKKLDRENIIKGTRAKRYYEKPCERRRRKEKVQAFTQMLRRRYAE